MTRGLCKKEFEFSIESASYAHLKLYHIGMVNEERERMLFCRLNSGVSSSGCCAVNDAHSSIEPNNNCIHLWRWLHVLCATSDCGKHATHETADNGSFYHNYFC